MTTVLFKQKETEQMYLVDPEDLAIIKLIET